MSPSFEFDNVCRLCMVLIDKLDVEMFVPLFKENQPMELARKIADIAGVEVIAGDGLPEQVCRSCVLQVDSCNAFRQKCQSSDRDFRHYLSGAHARVFRREFNLLGADTKEVFLNESLDSVISNTSELTSKTRRNSNSDEKTHQHGSHPARLQQPFSSSPTRVYGGNLPTMRDVVSNVSMWVSGGELYPWQRTAFQLEQTTASGDGKLAPGLASPGDQHHTGKQRNIKGAFEGTAYEGDGSLTAIMGNGKGQNKRCQLSHMAKESATNTLKGLCVLNQNAFSQAIPQKCKVECDANSISEVKPVGIVMYESLTDNINIVNSETTITLKKKTLVDSKDAIRSSLSLASRTVNLDVGDVKPPESFLMKTIQETGKLGSFIEDCERLGYAKRKKVMVKNYQCDICNKFLSSEGSLKVHKLNHTGIRPFRCNIEGCAKSFSQYGNLQTHIRSHLGIKPYECKMCGASFVQLANLQAHERKHTGAQPYTCRVCDATFAHASSLRSHALARHSDQVSGPSYPCLLCGRSFKSQNVLSKHITNVHDSKH